MIFFSYYILSMFTKDQHPATQIKSRQADRQTDRQTVLYAIKITNMMINKETVKRQEISIKIETIAGLETTL